MLHSARQIGFLADASRDLAPRFASRLRAFVLDAPSFISSCGFGGVFKRVRAIRRVASSKSWQGGLNDHVDQMDADVGLLRRLPFNGRGTLVPVYLDRDAARLLLGQQPAHVALLFEA